jgi:hypothetical protein
MKSRILLWLFLVLSACGVRPEPSSNTKYLSSIAPYVATESPEQLMHRALITHLSWIVNRYPGVYSWDGVSVPRVVYLDPDDIGRLNFSGGEAQPIALYVPLVQVIVLPKHFTHARFHSSWLVHELVHYLQDINGRMARSPCPSRIEAEAYTIEYEWLEAHGVPVLSPRETDFIRALYSCSNVP